MANNRTYYIYIHKNKINGEVYVGKSVNPKHRWGKNGSQYLLKRKSTGTFLHPKFASAILEYGWDNFDHMIVDKTDNSYESILLEIKYIDMYDSINNGYNIMRGSSNHNETFIERCKQRSKGANNQKSRKIIMKDFKTNKKLKYFECANDAARLLGFSDGKHIIDCCLGKRKYAFGYGWEYYDGNKFEEVKDYSIFKTDSYVNGNVPVLQYDINGNFLREFSSIKEAKLYSGSNTICLCCKGKRKTAAGFIWKYKDIESTRGNYNIKREV